MQFSEKGRNSIQKLKLKFVRKRERFLNWEKDLVQHIIRFLGFGTHKSKYIPIFFFWRVGMSRWIVTFSRNKCKCIKVSIWSLQGANFDSNWVNSIHLYSSLMKQILLGPLKPSEPNMLLLFCVLKIDLIIYMTIYPAFACIQWFISTECWVELKTVSNDVWSCAKYFFYWLEVLQWQTIYA